MIKEMEEDLPTLSEKEERAVMRDFEKAFNERLSMDEGPELDEETIKLLRKSYLEAMMDAKRRAKKKFTPKKYRHGGYWDKHKDDI